MSTAVEALKCITKDDICVHTHFHFVKKITKWKAINLFSVSTSYFLYPNGVVSRMYNVLNKYATIEFFYESVKHFFQYIHTYIHELYLNSNLSVA